MVDNFILAAAPDKIYCSFFSAEEFCQSIGSLIAVIIPPFFENKILVAGRLALAANGSVQHRIYFFGLQ